MFQRLQLAKQFVKFGIGNFRAVQHVIQVVVMIDLLAQVTDALDHILRSLFFWHWCYSLEAILGS